LRSSLFVGRSRALAFISNQFFGSKISTLAKVALYGIRGVGKSQISLHYAYERRPGSQHQQQYDHVFFVRANSFEALFSGYSGMANILGLCNHSLEPLEQDVLIFRVHEWLRYNTKWLLIFDNAQKPSDVRRFTPTMGTGHIIFTTNSLQVAEVLANAEGTLDIPPMSKEVGAELVFKIQRIPTDCQVLRRAAAEQLCELLRGLPIAIEQAVRDADSRDISIDQMNLLLQKATTVLEQQFPASLHESSSVAALLQQSLERVGLKNAQAAELFKVLIFLDNNSIPIEILTTGGPQLRDHLGRSETYDRGIYPEAMREFRERDEQMRRNKAQRKRTSPLDALRKIVKLGPSEENDRPLILPRTHSDSDDHLQGHYTSNKLLQNVLSDPLLIENAISDLLHAGLIRKPTDKTVWIHDLYASMTRDLIELQPELLKRVTVHLATTLVFLTYPIPERFPTWRNKDTFVTLLPSAIQVLHHCFKIRISAEGDKVIDLCTDSTIGPELSHLVGIALRGRHMPLQPVPGISTDDDELAVKYLRVAFEGYSRATQRLKAMPGVTKELINRVAIDDIETYNNHWHSWKARSEFGRNNERYGIAPARACDTCLKIAYVLQMQDATLDDAISFFELGLKLTGQLYGESHYESTQIAVYLGWAYKDAGKWERVLEFVEERIRLHKSWGPWTVIDGVHGYQMAMLMAIALENLGRLDEAEEHYLNALLTMELMYGGDAHECNDAMEHLLRLEVSRGNFDAAKSWLAKMVMTTLRSSVARFPIPKSSVRLANELNASLEALIQAAEKAHSMQAN
jgi:tetratricopeptide (TPR) repeat protein